MKRPENITCEDAKAWIDLAVTGDLPTDEKELLDVHCAQCAPCARRLATRRAVWEHYPAGIAPSDELISRTVASVRTPAAPVIRRLFPRSLPAVAAVAAVILLAFALVLNFAGRNVRHTRNRQLASVLADAFESTDGPAARTVLINIDESGSIQLTIVPARAPLPPSELPNTQFTNWVY